MYKEELSRMSSEVLSAIRDPILPFYHDGFVGYTIKL